MLRYQNSEPLQHYGRCRNRTPTDCESAPGDRRRAARARLPFYENWLTPPGLRDGKFGLAPLHAVLSFLRLEGQATYDQMMSRRGRYTADWAYLELWAVRTD